ncbi:MAG: RNA methyltransferase [Ruminococcaceae bacterium]|nr:RNA methyltransferase [Oscillospiraceae bacterium]
MAQIITINDINAAELKIYASLTEAQLKTDNGLFIAESVKVIKVALNKGLVPASFLMEERQIEGIGREILELCPNTPVYTASRQVLSQLTGFELTRGVLCAMKRPQMLSLDSALKDAKRIAVLERLSDSVNVGAIFRSAAALGIDAMLLFHNCAEPLNRRCVRVSMGSVFLVPWAFFDKENYPEPQDAVSYLKSKGFTTAAMALKDDSISIDSDLLNKADKLALFFGAEGDGLSLQTIENCDYTVKIPMYNDVDSLNVAAAAAISFWELKKQNKNFKDCL